MLKKFKQFIFTHINQMLPATGLSTTVRKIFWKASVTECLRHEFLNPAT